MRKLIISCALAFLLPLVANAQHTKVYRWVDDKGVVHFGDSIPAEFAEYPKEVLNEDAVTIGSLEGKKTPEQLEAERIETERRVAREMQRRADQALLSTYLTVEEILLHRDRRVELFQAQSRVTELYLSNLEQRLANLRRNAANYQPYSDSPDAPMIPDDLATDLQQTMATIERHQRNLKKFRTDEANIVTRFAGDISRFKVLKGLSQE